MEYKSQYEQDKFLNENFFHNKKNGVFIDIGAHDGVSLNNSYFFEKNLNWSGICIEPIPYLYEQLDKNRGCVKVKGCAWYEDTTKKFRIVKGYAEMLSGIVDTYDPSHIDRIINECNETDGSYEDVDMPCYNLNNLMEKNNFFNIDFLSIDTEGSELKILESIDFDKFNIKFILVENNYQNNAITELLKSKNYELSYRLVIDDVYVKKN